MMDIGSTEIPIEIGKRLSESITIYSISTATNINSQCKGT